jgi:hypothetical protein
MFFQLFMGPVHVVVESTTDLLWWIEKAVLPITTAVFLFILGIWATRLTDKVKEYVRLEGIRQFILTLLDGSILVSLTRQMQDFTAKADAFDVMENRGDDYHQRIVISLKSILDFSRSDLYDVFVRYHTSPSRLGSALLIEYLAAIDTLADGLPTRREVLSQIRQADLKATGELDTYRRRYRDARFAFQAQSTPLSTAEAKFNQQLPDFVHEPRRFDEMEAFYNQLFELCNNTMPDTSEFYRPFILELLRASEECAARAHSVIRIRESAPRIMREDAVMCRSTRIALESARRHLRSPLRPVSYLHRFARWLKGSRA